MKITFFGEKQRNRITSIMLTSSMNTKILLDCGCSPSSRDFLIIPNDLISEIQSIILSHAHLDHWGYLPQLIKKQYRNRVIMTPATFELLESFAIKDYFNFLDEKDKPTYKTIFDNMKQQIETYKYGNPITVKDLQIYLLPANHILGSSQILVDSTNENKKILYTGDFNPGNTILFNPITINLLKSQYHIELNPDSVIIECSNIDLSQKDYESEENQFIDVVNKTYENLGNVLIPAKALGDAQDFLIRYIFYCLNKNLDMPAEIFTLGSLEEVNKIYYKYKENFKDPRLIELFKTEMIIKNFNKYIQRNFGNLEDLFFNNKRNYGLKLFVATGGNFNVGSSKRMFNYLSRSSNNLVVIPKYLKSIHCDSQVLKSKLFSLHGNFDSIKKYISELEKHNKSKFFIVHGSERNLESLHMHLMKSNMISYIPKLYEEFKI